MGNTTMYHGVSPNVGYHGTSHCVSMNYSMRGSVTCTTGETLPWYIHISWAPVFAPRGTPTWDVPLCIPGIVGYMGYLMVHLTMYVVYAMVNPMVYPIYMVCMSHGEIGAPIIYSTVCPSLPKCPTVFLFHSPYVGVVGLRLMGFPMVHSTVHFVEYPTMACCMVNSYGQFVMRGVSHMARPMVYRMMCIPLLCIPWHSPRDNWSHLVCHMGGYSWNPWSIPDVCRDDPWRAPWGIPR